MGGGKVIEVDTKEEWDKQLGEAASAGKVVFVDFSAVWCGPCQMIGPYFAQLSEEFPNIIFLKVDVDKNTTVAADCGVSAMPTFQVFKDGQKVDEFVGASKDKLKAMVQKYA